MLKTEIHDHGDALGLGPLKDITSEFLQREISILQIVAENMGVITLNELDCQWIEQLSLASLENENDYFLKQNSPLKFNFLYVQAYLIRAYLLYCRINYQYIKGKYQCYAKRKIPITTNGGEIDNDNINTDMDPERLLIDEWNHLDEKNLDQLHNELKFFQRIMDVLENSAENYSSMKLSAFIRNTNYDHRFTEQFEQYRVQDFPLSQIRNVYRLYEKSMNQFQHAFINISHLFRVPIDKKLSDDLNRMLDRSFILFDDRAMKDELQGKIRTITEFPDDLKNVEDLLAGQWSQYFVDTCQHLCIENGILALLPREMKCENYVSLCLKRIDLQSRLQERTIDIEEKPNDLWSARLDISDTSQSNENSFQVFRNKNDDFLQMDANAIPSVGLSFLSTFSHPTGPIDWLDMLDNVIVATEPSKPLHSLSHSISYKSLFQLKISFVSLSPSVLFENSRAQAEKSTLKTARFSLIFLDDILINNIYRSDDKTSIDVQILLRNKDEKTCCEVTMITEQDGTRNQYFNATTTWKQISSWSKILNGNVETPIDNYNFWNVEQRNLIDEDQTISSTLDQVESTDVDVIVNEQQTCLVSIQESNDPLIIVDDDTMKNQHYLTDATVNAIYKQNKNIHHDQCLVYNHDYVPARETPLSALLSTRSSPIEFTLSRQKFEANATVTCDEQKIGIGFRCEPSMTLGCVQELACQLWKLNKRLYRLTLAGGSNIDEEYSLEDTDEAINDLRLNLISIADVKCKITYGDEVIIVSTTDETILSSILQEILQQRLIPFNELDMYALYLMDDHENPTNVDPETSIHDIRSASPNGLDIIPFQLQKK
ncbi:unnamed protein product [Rotaria socialis]|uniref:Uncharacterized protein n=2 Tax=Rotaria socialis TaxID=392032 RepID=A0A820QHZ3_9BILA|nr:unnamed protein product [Rotaria socialis]CAF4421548.1 unnamed protein product [Rotaria socialis]